MSQAPTTLDLEWMMDDPDPPISPPTPDPRHLQAFVLSVELPTKTKKHVLLFCRREARRKETNARGPRTTGALYRRSTSTAGRLMHEELECVYVNADVSEREPDPMQVRYLVEQKRS